MLPTRARQRLLRLFSSVILAGAAIQSAATAQPSQKPAAAAQDTTTTPVQNARDQWKDCQFNLQVIGCMDEHFTDGLRLIWKDGLRMEYHMVKTPQRDESVLMKDRLGGLWRREVLVQGNVILTHLGNGNRIMIPLRLTCRPPLKGYVGYCSD
jgi:hypothetical protein